MLHHTGFFHDGVLIFWKWCNLKKYIFFILQVFGEKPTPEDDVCSIDIASEDLAESYYKKIEVSIKTQFYYDWAKLLCISILSI